MGMERAVESNMVNELRRKREDAGVTVQDFAEALDISVVHARRLENGNVTPSFKTLRRWAELLGITAGELADLIVAQRR